MALFTLTFGHVLLMLLQSTTCLSTATSRDVPTPRLVLEMPKGTPLENIHTGRSGNLFLSTLNSSTLFELNLTDGTANSVSNPLNGSDAFTGIATIYADGASNCSTASTFAVSGGQLAASGFGFDPNSMSAYRVSCTTEPTICSVQNQITTDYNLNGMTSIPGKAFTFSADSVGGHILRFDWNSLEIAVVVTDDALGPPSNSSLPFGINGIKFHDGYFYFTNSGKGTFGRIKIDIETGLPASNGIEILATLPSPPAGIGNAYDDFAMDKDGNAYVTLHSYSVLKITSSGKQTFWVGRGSEGNFQEIFEPASATLSQDGKVLYICTIGGTDSATNITHSGQIWAVDI